MNYSNKILNTSSLSRCYIGCFIIVIHYSAMHGARWNDSSADDSLWQPQESLVLIFGFGLGTQIRFFRVVLSGLKNYLSRVSSGWRI